jgi:hypothetical protein
LGMLGEMIGGMGGMGRMGHRAYRANGAYGAYIRAALLRGYLYGKLFGDGAFYL